MTSISQKKAPKLIILMPLYNRANLLQRALDSIYMQKVNFKYSIIILDDASTDNGLEIAKENKKKFHNIDIVENKENSGLLKNIFIGHDMLKECEYFCVLDPDDYWTDEHYLQEAIEFLDYNQAYTIYSSNIDIQDCEGNKSVYLKTKIPHATSSYQAMLKSEPVFMPSTQSTLFRNVVYHNGVPHRLKKYIEEHSPQGFRADTFRFILHLKKGLAYFNNKVTAVYDMSSVGLWSDIPAAARDLQNALLYFHLSRYFETFEEDKKFYIFTAEQYLARSRTSLQFADLTEEETQKIIKLAEEIKAFYLA